MTKRIVSIGAMTYRAANMPEGHWHAAGLGDEADVHDDDLERFDRFNSAAPSGTYLPDAEVQSKGAEPTETLDVDQMTVEQLKAHAEAAGIDLAGATKKDDILAAVKAAVA